jgi:hypothetical protein
MAGTRGETDMLQTLKNTSKLPSRLAGRPDRTPGIDHRDGRSSGGILLVDEKMLEHGRLAL